MFPEGDAHFGYSSKGEGEKAIAPLKGPVQGGLNIGGACEPRPVGRGERASAGCHG